MSEQPGRYERSTSGMVGALLVTVLVILAFVGFRACDRTNLVVRPPHVDYLAEVGYAQRSGAALLYPRALPRGWRATQIEYSPGRRPELGLSMLTGGNEYAGFRQSPAPLPELLTTYVDPHVTAGRPVTLPGAAVARWATWTDSGGDTALAGRWHHETVLVFGSASRAELEALARSLTTRKV